MNDNFAGDTLTTALEGGSGYWAMFRKVERAADLTVISLEVKPEDERSTPWRRIDHAAITAAAQRILTDKSIKLHASYIGRIAADLRDEDSCMMDAIGADAVLQVAAFGDVIYG